MIGNMIYQTLFSRNRRMILIFGTVGFLVLPPALDRFSSNIFYHKINKGKTWPYLEKQILLRQANQANEDDDE